MQKKRALNIAAAVAALLAAVVLLVYLFCPVTLRLYARGLRGETLYTYDYATAGTLYVLHDAGAETLSFADVRGDGLFNTRRVRVGVVYDLGGEQLLRAEGVYELQGVTGINRSEYGRSVEFKRSVASRANGFDYLTYGVYTDYQYPDENEDLLYRADIGDLMVYVTFTPGEG